MTYRPLPVRPSRGLAFFSNRLSPRRFAALALAVIVLALLPVAALAEPPQISAKRDEARQVLAQIDQLDVSLERAIESYNRATVRLGQIKHAQAVNRNELAIARRNLKRTQDALASHLVAMYASADDNSSLGVLLGATSFGDFVGRLDTIQRIADQDTRIVREVKTFKRSVERQKRELAKARRRQDQFVAQRAEQKAAIDNQLAERRQLVASIRSEIARLQAEEEARQLRLKREAEARLAAQRAEAERQRLARVAALAQARQNGASEAQAQSVAEAVAPSAGVGVVASTPDAMVAPSSRYGGVVGAAMQYLGVPYVWGGASPSGFDCSGLVVYVFAQFGVSLPHYTGDLWNMGVPVSRDQLQPGDLVFFNGLGHMGIYMGGGQMIHAPHTGDVVKISDINSGYYVSSYVGARRIL